MTSQCQGVEATLPSTGTRGAPLSNTQGETRDKGGSVFKYSKVRQGTKGGYALSNTQGEARDKGGSVFNYSR